MTDPTADVRARRILNRIANALDDLDRLVGEAATPVEVLARTYARLDRPLGAKGAGLYQTMAMVRDTIAERLNREGPPGKSFSVDGAGTFERCYKGGTTHWDGARIARKVAARCADVSRFDPATGAMNDHDLPPGVLAEFVAAEIVACAGLDAASKAWRKTALDQRHIDYSDDIDVSGERRPSIRHQ